MNSAPSALTWVSADGAVRAQIVEEPAQGRGGAVFARPHQAPGVVIGHDQQIPLSLAVGDLIDADPAQPGRPVAGLAAGGEDPGHDV